jgi:hypothetical protein
VTTYILIYLLMALFSVSMGYSRKIGLWVSIGFLFVFLIGFREQVGGDWYNYLLHFKEMEYTKFYEVLKGEDPGYYLINLWMYDWGWGIYGVNVISAVIFITGLMRLARQQFNLWLAMSVAVPYLVIVVSMGYTRQAVAIGLVMWAIAALDEKKFIWFLILVALAASFHKSAVLMMGIGMFGQGTGRILRISAVLLVGIGLYEAFLQEHEERLWTNYVEVQMQSQGARIRVAMNFIPALLFFIFHKEWKKEYDDFAFWRIIAFGAIGTLFMVEFASTAVDRMALYMIPLQIVVFGRLPLLAKGKVGMTKTVNFILFYYAMVLLVWLNFATHAQYWLPYQNILFVDVI